MTPETPASKQARKALRQMADARARIEAAMAERDAAIARMYLDDEMSASQIARTLDMTESNVRLILKVSKAKKR